MFHLCSNTRRKVFNIVLVAIAFACIIFVTMVAKTLEYASLTSRYQISTVCNEVSFDQQRIPEAPSVLPLTSRTTLDNLISVGIPKFENSIYPIIHHRGYIINNPDLCRDARDISLLIVVKSNPPNFERRKIIRETWGNYKMFENLLVFRILFLMGSIDTETISGNISMESKKYGDILQGDFQDSYRNLTNKGVMGLRWIIENCMQAKMIVKVDDDVVIDTHKLLTNVYSQYADKVRYILCNIFMDGKAPIVRDHKHKWYVKDSELQLIGLQTKNIYPRYCSGFTVILSTDLVPAMYGVSHLTPFFWVDDVYMYGLLLTKVGTIDYFSLSRNYTFVHNDALKCFKSKSSCGILSVAETKLQNMLPIWNQIQSHHEVNITSSTDVTAHVS